MIEKTIIYNDIAAMPRTGKILRMVHNDRMAGSVPKWEDAADLASRVAPGAGRPFADILAMQGENQARVAPEAMDTQAGDAADMPALQPEQEFGFGDLLDIVNPLQHIPLVGHVYREITGDQIQPIGRIIGGTVYGGPLGAVLSATNVIVEQETGKDVTGNALALALRGDLPSRSPVRSAMRQDTMPAHVDMALADDPEINLNAAIRREATLRDSRAMLSSAGLSGTTLAFADLRAPQIPPQAENPQQNAPQQKPPRRPHYNE